MENQILNFELSSKQIKFKEIFNKQFVELEIYAISDIDPNRNNSHFVLDGMERAIPTMKNKPILGYFHNGDFEAHEGKMEYDFEIDKQFWNTENGERPLGIIRESDPVEIVEKDGLYWVKIRCALWTAYAYKQIKRLLKDRNKKVSVEITVDRSVIREDGVEDILDFTLNGITILGSHRNKPVIEGIPGAHLSILEKMADEAFSNQTKVLSFAYKAMEEGSTSDVVENNINVEGSMENPENLIQNGEAVENTAENVTANEPELTPENNLANFEGSANADNLENQACGDTQKNDCGNLRDHEDGDDNGSEGDDDDNDSDDETDDDELAMAKEEIAKMSAKIEELNGIIATTNEETAQLNERITELQTSVDNYAAMQAQSDTTIAELKAQCLEIETEKGNLATQFAEMKERAEAAEAKVHENFCKEMENAAKELMDGEVLKEEDKKSILENCTNGTYSCTEDIERAVSYAIYKARPVQEKRFSAPVNNVERINIKTDKVPDMTRAERIAARNSGNL